MIIWDVHGESVIGVRAIVTASQDGWDGQLFGLGAPIAIGADFQEVRQELASHVWQLVQGGEISVPESSIEAVRVYAHTVFDYPRQGDFSGAPVTVQAVADRLPEGWGAATNQPYAGLGDCVGKGESFQQARDDLAANLLMALEVGIDAVPDNWSGLKLVMRTRKSYPVASL